MKHTYIITTLLVGTLLAACGEKKSDLQTKKAELDKLKGEQADLNAKIKGLEGELTKLDPVKREEAKVKAVAVSPLTAGTFRHFVELQGSVDAKNNVQVTPKGQGGVITAMYVSEGTPVKQGQLIAKLDDQIVRESLAEVQTQLSLANTVFEKQSNLWKQQIGTELQYLQAKSNKESLERRISTIKAQLGQSSVTAPISGVVDQVIGKVGQVAAPGMGIVRVVNLSKLKVVAKVADTYSGTVKRGDAVQVIFPDIKKQINAPISFVSTSVDPLSRTFTIEIPLPSDNALKPNMLAQVKVNDFSKSNAIVINQNLIQNTENGQLVYVAVTEGNKKIARAKKVVVGQSYGGQIEITQGLSAGDQLITQGYQEVTDGQTISF
ncbi:efflux RND transporter periplasmic adaptor subunit [Fibrella forsythiae]|uniref:Efflux RND transporter periplasmic adaptor subunit n=1 Tax=Fibrella forsythiae TaxID=2817061 RepID=A0ABS3JK22_9BACT|nr:efflux RND transporter periplasmic adaptor subunit [Fibrella forsythiae]MBO0950348.1 efflux RND transporter periplasmic adaptor subunit [Fibrella forsythiae]